MKNKSMDDISGFVGALAGLANDVRNSAINKSHQIKKTMHAYDDIESLKQHIQDLENRITALEQDKQSKPKS